MIYVPDYFLAGNIDLVVSPVAAWKPHGDAKIPWTAKLDVMR